MSIQDQKTIGIPQDKHIIGTGNVAGLIKTMRLDKGMTQEEFANHIGISKVFLWELENKRKGIRLETFWLIMEKLGFNIYIERKR